MNADFHLTHSLFSDFFPNYVLLVRKFKINLKEHEPILMPIDSNITSDFKIYLWLQMLLMFYENSHKIPKCFIKIQ